MNTKNSLPDMLRCWSLVAAAGLVLSSNGVAQDAEAPAAKDPFAKEDKAQAGKPKAGAADDGAKIETFQQIAQIVEFIEAPHAEVRKWLTANPGAPDGDALRAEVQKWIEAGSAEVLSSQMLIARSGQRAKVESIRELIYPTEFEPIVGSPSAPHPVSFEVRNLGMTLEFDPVLEEKLIHLNLAPDWTELAGDCQQRAEPGGAVQPGDVRSPLIHTVRPTLQTVGTPGEWMLIDVETARSKQPGLEAVALNPERSVLVFSRSSIHASEAPVRDSNADDVGLASFGYVKLEWIDVEQAVVTRWLQKDDFGQWVGGVDGARLAVEELVKTGDASVAFTQLIPSRSGQRVKSESIREVIYPTEFDQSEQSTLSKPSVLETRNTGITAELDPVFYSGGAVVDLNFAPEIVDLVGHSVSQRYLDRETQEWKPDVMMPIFYTNKLTTQATVVMDQPLLVGVMMPHDENGQPDKDRRRLLFVTVTK